MRKTPSYFKSFSRPLPALALLCFIGAPVYAQSMPDRDNPADQRYDTQRRELAQFDQFLDSHREIAEQLRKDPSLVNNKEFVQKHPPLQTFMQDHPGVREEVGKDPNAVMRQEDRFDRRDEGHDSDTTTKELAQFDRFMDSH